MGLGRMASVDPMILIRDHVVILLCRVAHLRHARPVAQGDERRRRAAYLGYEDE